MDGTVGRTRITGPDRSVGASGVVQEVSSSWLAEGSVEGSAFAVLREVSWCLRFFEGFLSPLNESGLTGIFARLSRVIGSSDAVDRTVLRTERLVE